MSNVMRDAAVILLKEKLIPAALEDALRRYHAGADRGELRTLLCEAWGPSLPNDLARHRDAEARDDLAYWRQVSERKGRSDEL